MGVQIILPVKVSVTIDTMLNFDVAFDGHGRYMTLRRKFRPFSNFRKTSASVYNQYKPLNVA